MNSSVPLVSVIIPAYNCASFIVESLESVYQQTYTCWEIIVIDDGSTDTTRAVLEPHKERIRYFYQENQGGASARNTGLRKARGEFIAFLDNDDLWCSEKLSVQVGALEKYSECGLVGTDGKTFDESGILCESLFTERYRKWMIENQTQDPQLRMGWMDRELSFQNYIQSASSVMVRKQCLDRVGEFDPNMGIADDYDLWLRIAKVYPIILLNTCLYLWRYREGSQSGPREDRHLRWTRASILVLEKHWQSACPEIRSEVRKCLSKMCWECGIKYFQKNALSDSRTMFLGTFKHRRTFLPAFLYFLATYFPPGFINKVRGIKNLFETTKNTSLF